MDPRTYVDAAVKTDKTVPFYLQRLKRFDMDSRILCNLCQGTIERILPGAITGPLHPEGCQKGSKDPQGSQPP